MGRSWPGRHQRFKHTEIGEIPEEWEVVRIIDVADVDYGISAAVSQNTDPSIGWPILTGANLTLDGQIDLFKLVYHEPPSKERFHLRKSDLLLNWRSGSPKHVGKTVLFDLEGEYTYASFVLRIRSRGKLVPGFGHVLLNFMREAEYFSKDLSQQVNFKMNAAVFREVLIRLPPVHEQEEIAHTSVRFDSRLDSETRSLAALHNLKARMGKKVSRAPMPREIRGSGNPQGLIPDEAVSQRPLVDGDAATRLMAYHTRWLGATSVDELSGVTRSETYAASRW